MHFLSSSCFLNHQVGVHFSFAHQTLSLKRLRQRRRHRRQRRRRRRHRRRNRSHRRLLHHSRHYGVRKDNSFMVSFLLMVLGFHQRVSFVQVVFNGMELTIYIMEKSRMKRRKKERERERE